MISSSKKHHKVGISLQPPHYNYLEQKPATRAAWLEAPLEEFIFSKGRPAEVLRNLRRDYPIAFHGCSLNVGNPDGVRLEYLNKIRELSECYDPFIISECLCWTGFSNHNFHTLLPLPFTEDSIMTVVNNIDFVQNYLDRPLVLKNISTYISYHHNEMTEWDFISEVSRRSGSALLLDLNNIYINAYNHSYDPRYFINNIPLERVAQVHVGGAKDLTSHFKETGDSEIPCEVWNLLKTIAQRIHHTPVSLSHSLDTTNFTKIETDICRAALILQDSYEIERSTESI